METVVTEDDVHSLPPDADRRAASRKRTPEQHGIIAARVRPGRDATVIDVSSGGTLIETVHRLLPGTVVELHLAAVDRHTTIRGRVIRSSVASLHGGGVRYRGAVMFERPLASFVDVDGYAVPNGFCACRCHGREDATPPTL